MKDIIIKRRYQIIDLVHEELICNTFLAKIIDSEKLVVLKQFNLAHLPGEFHSALIEKIAAVIKLDHPVLIKLLDYEFDDSASILYLIYEKFNARPLAQVAEERGFFSHEKVIDILERVAEGIAYLNSNNYYHGALNFDNIFIANDGAVKLGDYIIYNEINSYNIKLNKGSGIIDNAIFLAPEQLSLGLGTKASDIYSLGMILYRIYSGAYPYKSLCDVKKINKEISRGLEPPTAEGEVIPPYVSNLIMIMLEKDSKLRFKNLQDVIASFRDKSIVNGNSIGGDNILKQLKGEYISDMKNSKPDQRKKKYKLLGIIGIAGLFLFIAVYGFYQSYFNSIREVKIPDLRNVYKEEALIVLKSLGLNPELAGEVEDDIVSANNVVSTMPEIGRVVKEGRVVRLFISKGQAMLSVPAVVGLTQDEAFSAIKEAHLVPKVVEKIFSNSVPRGTIMGQEPLQNTSLLPGTEVQLKVCEGYPVELTVEPSKDPASDKQSVKLKFSILEGWNESRVKIKIATGGQSETVYDESHRPGDVMLLEFEESLNSKITVYYDGNTAFEGYVKDFLP